MVQSQRGPNPRPTDGLLLTRQDNHITKVMWEQKVS